MTKIIRRQVMALCRTRPFSPVQRVGFISVPHFVSDQRRFFREGFLQGLPHVNDSNNPLAVELETENDPPAEVF
jgi:hypothetical protein